MSATASPRVSANEIADALGRPRPTPEQRAVIEAPLEPMLVVAGAGSGKTETMASRVVWLVANEIVQPQEVLGLTFTRKAAGELAERINQRLRLLGATDLWTPPSDDDGTPVLGESPTVSTYNAYAGRIVTEHGLRLGLEPDSRMLSQAASWQFAHEAVASWDGPMDAVGPKEAAVTSAVLATAGQLGEHLVTPDDLRAYYANFIAQLDGLPRSKRVKRYGKPMDEIADKIDAHLQILPIVERYVDLKRERTAMDFSDQIGFAAQLASRFPLVGARERARYRTVLLDEFQDTSEAQIQFLAGLFAAREGVTDAPGVTAVGDPHQSIFGWRGASATTLAKFREEFATSPGALTPVASLSVSWRNDRAILDAANLVAVPLNRATKVPVKTLAAREGAGNGRVLAARYDTDVEEAGAIADWIAAEREKAGEGEAPTAAVLCRKRSQFVPVMDALNARGIPAEAVGLGGLLETPEVVDLVSLLWVVDDPGRGDHLMRLLTGSSMQLGPADIEGLATWAREIHQRNLDEAAERLAAEGHTATTREQRDLADDTRDDVSLVEAMDELPDDPAWVGKEGQRISLAALTRLRSLNSALDQLRMLTGLPLADFVGEAERVLGLDIEVLARPGYDPSSARAHLDAFADVAGTFSMQAERPTLGGFLDWLDAARDQERGLEMPAIEVNRHAVQVLTVHAAKGLEWDIVAIPGLNDGVFPSRDGRTQAADDDWEFKAYAVKGWTSGLDSIPYALRGDADGLPELNIARTVEMSEVKDLYAAYLESSADYALLEERRLAYVALTRAKSAMLLTAPVWTSGKNPRVTSDFLNEIREADGLCETLTWAEMPPTVVDGEAPQNPLEAEPTQAVWPSSDDDSNRAELATLARRVHEEVEKTPREATSPTTQQGAPLPGTPEDHDLEVDLLLAEREAQRRRASERARAVLPAHLSASSVVALASDPREFARALRRPLPQPPALAARRGTAFHAWVEQHYSSAALVDIDTLPGFADEDAAPDAELPRLQANFLASEWADRTPSAVEVAVETVVDGYAIRGRIDAVFARPDGGFTIVDWKTGSTPPPDVMRHRALQLSAYAVAYARLRELPESMVDGAFFFASTGETVRPELLGAAAIGQLLTDATLSE